MVEVMFIDWGNSSTVKEGELRQLTEDLILIPDQSFTVELNLIKPLAKRDKYL